MTVMKVLMLLVFTRNVLSQVPLGLVCDVKNIGCIKQSTELFLKTTSYTHPDIGTVGIDPLVLPVFDVDLRSVGLFLRNVGLTMRGLKDLKLMHFEMNNSTKIINVIVEYYMSLEGSIAITFSESSTVVSGTQTSSGSVLSSIFFPYAMKPDAKGDEHFDIGKENTICTIIDHPYVRFDLTLWHNITDLTEVGKYTDEKKNAIIRRALCKAHNKLIEVFTNNLRKATVLLPAKKIFKGVVTTTTEDPKNSTSQTSEPTVSNED